MRLNRLTEGVSYLDGAVSLGLVALDGGGVLLVDAGLDESVGRRVLSLLRAEGLCLEAILLTHSHADHCGGAPYLARASGARVLAPALEAAVVENPVLEPLYLFGGAAPPAPLRTKFFLAPGVRVDEVVGPGPLTSLGSSAAGPLEVIPLPGHSLGQVGLRAGEVFFCADAVLAPEVAAKHGVPLNADLAATLASFDLLLARSERWFVLAHGGAVRDVDVRSVVEANRRIILETLALVEDLVRRPLSVEEVLAGVAQRKGLSLGDLGRYYLFHLTVLAYLGYLVDQGKVTALYREGRQLFSAEPPPSAGGP
ncbi:MAG: MBL fold metallo-hydrolase [Firmicutes bacterium]|nr:MBL fold metallo-hydrolase [Bacillota bacterium]